MVFCPKCGASLKITQASAGQIRRADYRYEKAESREKQEKREKSEKTEKHEKHEHEFIGPLIGGFILLFLGFAFFFETTHIVGREFLWAVFLVIIGVLIIFGVLYGAILTSRRHPRT
jgi:cation transport ATPase